MHVKPKCCVRTCRLTRKDTHVLGFTEDLPELPWGAASGGRKGRSSPDAQGSGIHKRKIRPTTRQSFSWTAVCTALLTVTPKAGHVFTCPFQSLASPQKSHQARSPGCQHRATCRLLTSAGVHIPPRTPRIQLWPGTGALTSTQEAPRGRGSLLRGPCAAARAPTIHP